MARLCPGGRGQVQARWQGVTTIRGGSPSDPNAARGGSVAPSCPRCPTCVAVAVPVPLVRGQLMVPWQGGSARLRPPSLQGPGGLTATWLSLS